MMYYLPLSVEARDLCDMWIYAQGSDFTYVLVRTLCQKSRASRAMIRGWCGWGADAMGPRECLLQQQWPYLVHNTVLIPVIQHRTTLQLLHEIRSSCLAQFSPNTNTDCRTRTYLLVTFYGTVRPITLNVLHFTRTAVPYINKYSSTSYKICTHTRSTY